MSHEWSLAIKYVKHSQAMFVRPAQHLPTHSTANEKRSSMHWHSPLGGEVLDKAAIHSPTNAVGSDVLGISSTTTPNTIDTSRSPGWKWPVSTNLESNSLHNMRSCLSSSGLPNYQFHQIQDKLKKLGKYSFEQIRSCSLASARHQLPATTFWGKTWKHQRLSSSYGSILLGKRGHFFEDSQMQSIGQCMLALWNFNSIYLHPDMKLFFLPTVSAGFQAGELGDIHLGLGRKPVKWCENVGKMRNLT